MFSNEFENLYTETEIKMSVDIHATSSEALLDVVANNTKVALFTKKLGQIRMWNDVHDNTYYVFGGGDLIYNMTWSPSNLKARVFLDINFEKVVLWEDWDGMTNFPIPMISSIHVFIEFYDENNKIVDPDDCTICAGVLRDIELYRGKAISFEMKGITLYNALNSIVPSLELLREYYQRHGRELEIVPVNELL